MQKLPVSVIILAHQHNQLLDQAVASASWAAEIVIVATTTKVKLIEPAKLIQYPDPLTSFADLRNWSMTQVSYDWVLFLDSDEQLPDDTSSLIAPYIKRQDLVGYYLTRQDVFLGKMLHGGEAKIELLRFLKKEYATFEGKVHEIAVAQGATMHIPLVIKHFAHQSISSFLTKVGRYAQLVAESRKQSGFHLWELLVLPPSKFIWNYFFKLGFKDGWRGVIYALMMSIHSAAVRVFLYENNGK